MPETNAKASGAGGEDQKVGTNETRTLPTAPDDNAPRRCRADHLTMPLLTRFAITRDVVRVGSRGHTNASPLFVAGSGTDH